MEPAGYERRWEVRRGAGRSAGDEARESYYGLPVIHKPHWKWLVIVYFFLGGISGAAYVIAAIADLVGGREGKRIARVGRYVSLAALLPSPLLLILDLGRPERFLNMLRVFKFRSPMSVGTWGLTVFGAFATASATGQLARDGVVRRPGAVARLLRALPLPLLGVVGSGPAFFVSGYTGVLLAATAVPLWTRNALLMGPLFVASSMANASAAVTLVLALVRGTSHDTLRRLERLDTLAALAELALLFAARRRLGPTLARPLDTGELAPLYRGGVLGLGIVVPLAVQLRAAWLGGRGSRLVAALSALATLAGGFCFRYVIVMAGRASADDPQATFELTRHPEVSRDPAGGTPHER